MASNSDCPLLDKLPRELRDEIFDYALSAQETFFIDTPDIGATLYLRKRDGVVSDAGTGQMSALKCYHALVATNKQVRAEASASFFRVNKFEIEIEKCLATGRTSMMRPADVAEGRFYRLPEPFVQGMRHVVVRVRLLKYELSVHPGLWVYDTRRAECAVKIHRKMEETTTIKSERDAMFLEDGLCGTYWDETTGKYEMNRTTVVNEALAELFEAIDGRSLGGRMVKQVMSILLDFGQRSM